MKSNKRSTFQGGPIDLLSLNRSQLAAFVCNLKRSAQREIVAELERLERKEAKKHD